MKAGLNQGLALVQVPLKRRERRRKTTSVVSFRCRFVFFSYLVVRSLVGWLFRFERVFFGYNQRMVIFFGEVSDVFFWG